MKKHILHQLLCEAVADVQKQQLDEFLAEYKDFDVKVQKEHLKHLSRCLEELKRHAATETFDKNSKGIYTRKFWKMYEEAKQLQSKIQRYEENKDLIDTFARTHSKYVLHKHGKIV